MYHRISGILPTLAVSFALLSSPLLAGAAEFDNIVRAFEQQSGCEHTHVPLMWLARSVVAVGRPVGASELKLAIFENPTVAPADFSGIVNGALNSSWKPIIRTRSRNGDVTTIFLQQDRGNAVRLLIANRDQSDAMLMQVRLNVNRLLHFVDEHQHPSPDERR